MVQVFDDLVVETVVARTEINNVMQLLEKEKVSFLFPNEESPLSSLKILELTFVSTIIFISKGLSWGRKKKICSELSL